MALERDAGSAAWPRGVKPVAALFRTQPVLAFYLLAFAISWGGFVLVVGPHGITSDDWRAEGAFLGAVLVMLAGPCVAGLLSIGLAGGRAGFRDLLARLATWRVGARWYAMAILPAPILTGGVLVALSLTSPIFTSDRKWIVVLSGMAAGVTTLCEEIGWTGFAVPRLRVRFSVLATGLIVGVLWGSWHLLQQIFISGTYAGTIPRVVYLPLGFLSAVAMLTAYRVLMVWVYDRTRSLFVTTLMHASLTASNVFIFTPDATGTASLIYGWLLAGAVWVVVAVVALANRGVR
jgi:membrane protease YdiL (CAAX protease family)